MDSKNQLFLSKDPQNNDAYFNSHDNPAEDLYSMMQQNSEVRSITGAHGRINRSRDKIYTYVAKTNENPTPENLSWVVIKDLKSSKNSITIIPMKGEGMGEYPYRALRTVESESTLKTSPAVNVEAPIFEETQRFTCSSSPGYVHNTGYEAIFDIRIIQLSIPGELQEGTDYTYNSDTGEITILVGKTSPYNYLEVIFKASPTSNNRETKGSWSVYLDHSIIWNDQLFKDTVLERYSSVTVGYGYPERILTVWEGYTANYPDESIVIPFIEQYGQNFRFRSGWSDEILVDVYPQAESTRIDFIDWEYNKVRLPEHQYYGSGGVSYYLEYIDETGNLIEEEVLVNGVGSVLIGNPIGEDKKHHKVSLKFEPETISLEYDDVVQTTLPIGIDEGMWWLNNFANRQIINTEKKVYALKVNGLAYDLIELYPNYRTIKTSINDLSYYLIDGKIIFCDSISSAETPNLYMYDTVTEQEFVITGTLPAGYLQIAIFQFAQKLDKDRYILFGAYDSGTISHPEYCVLIYWDDVSESYKYRSVFDGTPPYSWKSVRRILGAHKGKILIKFTEDSTIGENGVIDGGFKNYILYDIDKGTHKVITRKDGTPLVGDELRYSFDAVKLMNVPISEDPMQF